MMDNSTPLDERKKILLNLASKIIKADNEAIEILKRTPLCDTRGVKRASRDTKDPNPLSSTMAVMSQMYPITIDIKKAKEYKVPEELYLNVDDKHIAGRVICKKNAVDWWVDKAPMPNEDFIKMIDILFRLPRKQVNDYYCLSWERSRIKFRPIVLSRKAVPTQEVICNVPTHQRDNAIIQVLAPDNVIPYDQIDPDVIGVLKSIKDSSLSSKMAITTQSQVLKNMMDPKVRFLPSTSGIHSSIGYFRHAYCQSNFLISNLNINEADDTDIDAQTNGALLNFCTMVQYAVKKSRISVEDFRKQVAASSILGFNIRDLVQRHQGTTTTCIKFMRALLGMKSNMTSIIKSVEFSPGIGPKLRVIMYKNKRGVHFKAYEGEERVNFRSVSCRGQFTHNGSLVTSIVCNRIPKDEIRATLASIGVYCKIGFLEDKSESLYAMTQKRYETLRMNPWVVVRCEKELWMKFNTMTCGRIGELEIRSETEFEEGPKVDCHLTEDRQIMYQGTRSVDVELPIRPAEPISTMVLMPPGPLDDFLTIPDKLKRKIEFYLRHFSQLTSAIRAKDFTYRNEEMFIDVPKKIAKLVSYSARYLILNAFKPENEEFWHPLGVCFWYCYAWGVPSDSGAFQFNFDIAGVIEIDFAMQRGAVQIDREKSTYLVCGVPYCELNRSPMDVGVYMHGLIRGYRLSTGEDSSIEMVTLKKLMSISHLLMPGESRRIHFGGRVFIATKDEEIREKTDQTVNRQIVNATSGDTALDLFSRLLKGEKRTLSVGGSVKSIVKRVRRVGNEQSSVGDEKECGMEFDDW